MEAIDLLKQFQKTEERFRRMDLGMLHPGVTHGEYMVLSRIHANSRQYGDICGAHVSDIVRDLGIAPPGISRVLRSLESKGLVLRKSDQKDRRNTCVCLTDEGAQIRQTGHDKLKRFAQESVKRMGMERMQELILLWGQLADAMEEQLQNGKKGE